MNEACGGSNDDARTCPRGHWRPAEDEKLRQLVDKYGPQNWNSIAEKLQGRSGKSCRLRWFNQLDRRPFSEEEEDRLLAAHRIHGNKWAFLSRLFPGRTDNAVKNYWHVIMARKQREKSKFNGKRIYQDHNVATSDYSKSPSNYIFRRKISRIDQEDYYGSRINFESGGIFELQSQNKDKLFSIPSPSGSYVSWPTSLPDIFMKKRKLSGFGDNINKKRAILNPFPYFDYGTVYEHDLSTAEENPRACENERTSIEKQVEEKFVKKKDVPFIDFLGVGISS